MRSLVSAAVLAALATIAASCAKSTQTSEEPCQRGYALCGNTCVRLADDALNCGACGHACGIQEVCAAGACLQDCAKSLHAPITDAWGIAWDGLERSQSGVNFQAARDACSAMGGRLPTVSELYRVSAKKTGAVGDVYTTGYVWSLTPDSLTLGHVVRLSDGDVSNQPFTTAWRYRCVCPPERPLAFTSGACFGPPGNECAPLLPDHRFNFDEEDRPTLSKPAAMFECAASGGELPTAERLVAAVATGLPNGSNALLHTADDTSITDFVTRGETLDEAVQFLGTAVNQLIWSWFDTDRPFRCFGPARADLVAPSVAKTFQASRGGRAVDIDPSGISSYSSAAWSCFQRGGHLPTGSELAAFAMQGLPARTYSGMRLTSDQVAGANAANGGQVLTFAWDGEARWLIDPALATSTANKDAVPYNASGASAVGRTPKSSTATMAFQCVYYAVDPTFAPPAICQAGDPCFEVDVGGAGTGVRPRMWFDRNDRPAATFYQAVSACAKLGGRLPTGRDYLEAIRSGMLGYNVSLMTGDLVGSVYATTITWPGGAQPNFADEGSTVIDSNSGTARYRCMWTNELR
jgi:hypothetical protein